MVSPFIGSGAGLVPSTVRFSPSIQQRKKLYWEAKDVDVSRQIIQVFTDACQQIADMVKQLNCLTNS